MGKQNATEGVTKIKKDSRSPLQSKERKINVNTSVHQHNSWVIQPDGELLGVSCTSLKTSPTLIQQIFIELLHCSSC